MAGVVEGTFQNPPIPCFEVSVAATTSGFCGTKVCYGTGVSCADEAKCSYPVRTAFKSGVRRMRPAVVSVSTCCRMEK